MSSSKYLHDIIKQNEKLYIFSTEALDIGVLQQELVKVKQNGYRVVNGHHIRKSYMVLFA